VQFVDAARVSDERLYFERDPHWTATGHRVAAGVLADVVRQYIPLRLRPVDARALEASWP
jgi:hypothetical protein